MKVSVQHQLTGIKKCLNAIVKFQEGNVELGMGEILRSISAMLDSMEALDFTGALSGDIAAGRTAVENKDVAGGYAAVASAEAKLV